MESQSVELKLLPSGTDGNNPVIGNSHPTAGQSSKTDSVIPVGDGKENSHDGNFVCNSDAEKDWEENCSSSNEWSSPGGVFYVFSCYYAKILVAISSVLIFTELLHGKIPLFFFHGYLFTYLTGAGIICFIGFYVSILAEKWLRFPSEEKKAADPLKFGSLRLSSETSFYLKFGAAVFGVVTLIYNALEIASIFTMPYNCMDELNLAQPVLHGLFSLLQLHFLFADSKKVSHYLGVFRHAALMHVVATNIAIALKLVLWKSAEDWLDVLHVKHNSSQRWPSNEFALHLHTVESDPKSSDASKHVPLHKIYFTTNCWWRRPEEEKTEDLIELVMCLQNSTAGSLWGQAVPYLYPFIIQYCIAAAGIISVMWSSLHFPNTRVHPFAECRDSLENPRKNFKSCCLNSSKGFVLGLMVLVASIFVVVLSFISEEQYSTVFSAVTLRCVILGLSTLAPVIGLLQTKRAKFKALQRSKLTETFQNVGMSAVYVYGCCILVVGAMEMNTGERSLLFVEALDGALMVLQACLQSLFIQQMSTKCLKLSRRNGNPEKNVAIFLVCCNLALWLLESFIMQHKASNILQREFYGDIVWSVISRILFPLVIFYRFHSSVSFIEIWRRSFRIVGN